MCIPLMEDLIKYMDQDDLKISNNLFDKTIEIFQLVPSAIVFFYDVMQLYSEKDKDFKEKLIMHNINIAFEKLSILPNNDIYKYYKEVLLSQPNIQEFVDNSCAITTKVRGLVDHHVKSWIERLSFRNIYLEPPEPGHSSLTSTMNAASFVDYEVLNIIDLEILSRSIYECCYLIFPADDDHDGRKSRSDEIYRRQRLFEAFKYYGIESPPQTAASAAGRNKNNNHTTMDLWCDYGKVFILRLLRRILSSALRTKINGVVSNEIASYLETFPTRTRCCLVNVDHHDDNIVEGNTHYDPKIAPNLNCHFWTNLKFINLINNDDHTFKARSENVSTVITHDETHHSPGGKSIKFAAEITQAIKQTCYEAKSFFTAIPEQVPRLMLQKYPYFDRDTDIRQFICPEISNIIHTCLEKFIESNSKILQHLTEPRCYGDDSCETKCYLSTLKKYAVVIIIFENIQKNRFYFDACNSDYLSTMLDKSIPSTYDDVDEKEGDDIGNFLPPEPNKAAIRLKDCLRQALCSFYESWSKLTAKILYSKYLEPTILLKYTDKNALANLPAFSWLTYDLHDTLENTKLAERLLVPVNPSNYLINYMQKANEFVFDFFSYEYSKALVIQLKTELSVKLLEAYKEFLKSISNLISHSKSFPQNVILQILYDLKFAQLCLSGIKIDDLKVAEQNFLSLVDPFDYRLLAESIENNVLINLKQYSGLFNTFNIAIPNLNKRNQKNPTDTNYNNNNRTNEIHLNTQDILQFFEIK